MPTSDGDQSRLNERRPPPIGRLRSSVVRFFRSSRTWIDLGVLAPIGMLVLSAIMLLDLRRDAWDKAERTSKNLLQVIERDIARNVEIIDLSLQAAISNLKSPGVAEADPALRQLVLFDRATTARDMGVMLIVNENGDSIIDSNAVPARSSTMPTAATFKFTRRAPISGSISARR
ncbi:hypothetical protein GCM10025880_54770 [Methylorubrum aminovorans]|nr:hypothetical protein GCM10025880_54770 [Methylorubrum aminovorans]